MVSVYPIFSENETFCLVGWRANLNPFAVHLFRINVVLIGEVDLIAKKRQQTHPEADKCTLEDFGLVASQK